MSTQLAILKNPRLAVDDRGTVTLRFDAAIEGLRALQIIDLERDKLGTAKLVDLIHAAGSFERLEGTPILVEKDISIMTYLRPANV